MSGSKEVSDNREAYRKHGEKAMVRKRKKHPRTLET